MVYLFDLYSLCEDIVMVKVLKMLVAVGLFCSATYLVAQEAALATQEQDASVVVAQADTKDEAVAVAQTEVVAEVAPVVEEPAVVVADTDVKSPVEDAVQVANIDEEILEAAEKVLAEDAATQVATVDKEYDLNFDDFEFDEEDGI